MKNYWLTSNLVNGLSTIVTADKIIAPIQLVEMKIYPSEYTIPTTREYTIPTTAKIIHHDDEAFVDSHPCLVPIGAVKNTAGTGLLR